MARTDVEVDARLGDYVLGARLSASNEIQRSNGSVRIGIRSAHDGDVHDVLHTPPWSSSYEASRLALVARVACRAQCTTMLTLATAASTPSLV